MANKLTVQGELAKIKQSRQFMVIGLLLFAVAVAWVSVSLLTSQQRTKISPEQQEMAKPLQPTLNTEVIDSLSGEQFFSENDLREFTIYKLLSTQDGSKVVVPIDTPEDAFNDIGSTGASGDDEQTESVNLFGSLIDDEESTGSGEPEAEPDAEQPSAEPTESTGPTENTGPPGNEI